MLAGAASTSGSGLPVPQNSSPPRRRGGLRAAAHAGRLTCPHPRCPDPRFIARGGGERRHHFAHKVAGQEHRSSAVWRHQALLMLSDWVTIRYPHLELTLDKENDASLSIRSPRSGQVLRLTLTYDRRYQSPQPEPGEQLLVGHSRALVRPRQEAQGGRRRRLSPSAPGSAARTRWPGAPHWPRRAA